MIDQVGILVKEITNIAAVNSSGCAIKACYGGSEMGQGQGQEGVIQSS